MRFLKENCDVQNLSPLTLAFVGDTVFDLLIREHLVCIANRPVKALHKSAASFVNAGAQCAFAKKLTDILSEDEMEIFKRGRNAHANHKAKNATQEDYHYATGFEALLGYLYLSEKEERLLEIFDYIMEEEEN